MSEETPPIDQNFAEKIIIRAVERYPTYTTPPTDYDSDFILKLDRESDLSPDQKFGMLRTAIFNRPGVTRSEANAAVDMVDFIHCAGTHLLFAECENSISREAILKASFFGTKIKNVIATPTNKEKSELIQVSTQLAYSLDQLFRQKSTHDAEAWSEYLSTPSLLRSNIVRKILGLEPMRKPYSRMLNLSPDTIRKIAGLQSANSVQDDYPLSKSIYGVLIQEANQIPKSIGLDRTGYIPQILRAFTAKLSNKDVFENPNAIVDYSELSKILTFCDPILYSELRLPIIYGNFAKHLALRNVQSALTEI